MQIWKSKAKDLLKDLVSELVQEAETKSKQLNSRRRIIMRATVEVETSHRLFRAPKGDNGGSGGKKWAIQVDFD